MNVLSVIFNGSVCLYPYPEDISLKVKKSHDTEYEEAALVMHADTMNAKRHPH